MSAERDRRTTLRAIEALAFDAYGTLFDVFSITALCEELFPGHGEALAQVWRAKQLQYSLLRSLMGRYVDFWHITRDGLVYAANALRIDLTGPAEHRLMEAYLNLAVFPDVKPGLETLKGLGLRLAILSNGAPRMLEQVTTSAGIGALVDATISADEVKAFKPSPLVYRQALVRLRVEPQQLGFVSSNSWDIQGAAAAGLTTFWIRRTPAEPPEELAQSADWVVGSLTELGGILQPQSEPPGRPPA